MLELSLNILDLAQNSIAAGADLIQISVFEDTRKDILAITIEDNGSGIQNHELKKVTDPFYTTRTTRKVGLGIPFFKMNAELTGGKLKIDSKPGKGTKIYAEFGLSHIDRMPLGDIAATICSLIVCNPQLDFVYLHKRDDNSFTLNTRQLKERLDEIEISNPEVISWIKRFINENLYELNGG